MRDGDAFGVAAQGTDAALVMGVLKRGSQNLVNRSIDLFFGRIEFDSAATTVHSEPSGIARFNHSLRGVCL
jgi:hypothetical protein